MPVLIGLLFGRLFMQIAFSRLVLTAVVWAAVYGLAEDLGNRFVSRGAGWMTGLLACAALLAWSLWRPSRSRAKIWMLDGVYVWLRLGMIAAGVLTFAALLHDGGVGAPWLADAWPFMVGGVAAWAAQRWLSLVLVRSHRREGDLSMLPR